MTSIFIAFLRVSNIQQGLRRKFWPTHHYGQVFVQREINSNPTHRLTRSIEVLMIVIEH